MCSGFSYKRFIVRSGVAERLDDRPDIWHIMSAFVRDPDRPKEPGARRGSFLLQLITTSEDRWGLLHRSDVPLAALAMSDQMPA